MRGGVRGTPAPEALESDSRGACAPLDTFSNSLRHHISHHDVLRRTNNRTRLRIAHRSSSSTHHITDARRSMLYAALAPIACASDTTNKKLQRSPDRRNDTAQDMGAFSHRGTRTGAGLLIAAQRPQMTAR